MSAHHAVSQRVMFRLLAVAFWALGLARASDALRVHMGQSSIALWSWMDAIFGLCFFIIATILWLEAKHMGRDRDLPPG